MLSLLIQNKETCAFIDLLVNKLRIKVQRTLTRRLPVSTDFEFLLAYNDVHLNSGFGFPKFSWKLRYLVLFGDRIRVLQRSLDMGPFWCFNVKTINCGLFCLQRHRQGVSRWLINENVFSRLGHLGRQSWLFFFFERPSKSFVFKKFSLCQAFGSKSCLYLGQKYRPVFIIFFSPYKVRVRAIHN